jgi:hypothetical protein
MMARQTQAQNKTNKAAVASANTDSVTLSQKSLSA